MAEPVAPETPAVNPAAPVAPETPAPQVPVAPTTPTPEDQEASEWDDAAKELFPGAKSDKQDDKKDEPAKPEEGDESKKTPEIDPNETPEQKADREAKEAAEAAEEAGKNNAGPEQAARDARLAARESLKQVEAVKTDVREKMFADLPQVLQDADGDPINTIEDVQKLINPRTGVEFTEEEAGMWLLSAQQQFNKHMAEVEKKIERIADVNVDIKDQADSINYEFGELLKSNTELRDKLWATYEKTLVKDEKTGIIIDAPVSLEEFYRVALTPYVEAAKQKETDVSAQAANEAQAKADDEARRKKTRADRSDIYGGGKPDTTDPEDKEWGEAAEAVFGPLK